MSKLQVGTWKGALIDWGVTEAKTGSVGIVLQFAIDVNDDLVHSDKVLYLTDKTKARTIETLYKLGFDGNLEGLAGGRDKGGLTKGCNVILDCQEEKSQSGEEVVRIQWINLPGEVHGIQKVDQKKGASLLAGFKADFLSLKPASGVAKKGLNLD